MQVSLNKILLQLYVQVEISVTFTTIFLFLNSIVTYQGLVY